MKFPDRVLVDKRILGFLSAMLLPGLLAVGCVSLTKPKVVSEKCPTSTSPTCSDDPNQSNPPGDDAKNDTAEDSPSDQPWGEETAIVKPDAGLDVPPTAPDTADVAEVNKDTRADGTDTASTPYDAQADKEPGAEPGPELPRAEPGAEPKSGPEPGPEPSVEAGLEPGPEPGPEPAPEPGPDGPPGPCSNPTLIAMGSGKTQGNFSLNTVDAICVYTCDTILGWNCSNFAGRTVVVNGTTMTCTDGKNQAALTPKNGYNVLQISGGTYSFAAISWWGSPATSCTAPAGGF